MSENPLTNLIQVTPLTPWAIADQAVAARALVDYRRTLSANSLRRQKSDLSSFAQYLNGVGVTVTTQALMEEVSTWSAITYGLVGGFVQHQLERGYAIASINSHLSTIKRYCAIAAKAGRLDASALTLIGEVKGFGHKQGRNIDETRTVTRIGHKKAEAVTVTKAEANQLKHNQPNTPQGRRDALLMCLLLDHGLRCGEIAGLTWASVDLDEETLTFYRKKVDAIQTHELTKDTRLVLRRYQLDVQARPSDYLLSGSRRSGRLEGRMSERAITKRANVLGERIGIHQLSAHDGRHTWATFATRSGTDIKTLQDAGGWKSPSMPLRYAASAQIANAGVKLD